jgi:acyl-CoA thioester hydrolase
MKIYKRSDFDFWTTINTHWGDMDGLRHINHARYLTYMETARLDLYQNLGHDMARWDMESSSILASLEVNYLEQVKHPAVLMVGQRITRIGTKSYDITTAIYKNDEENPIVQANFTLVSINYKTGNTVPVPEEFRKYLNPISE